MGIIIIPFAAFIIAILTFFSGFGLGTILTPVFMVFFPVDLAIALTGVVHFLNNIFKLVLVGKKADKKIILHFGIPAVLAAILGSWLLLNITDLKPIFTYEISGNSFEVFPVKFIISILLICFAILDLVPYFNKLQFSKNKLPLGGALSGFFGGLSGNQGALRSAFLIKAGLSKESFVGTNAVSGFIVDFVRLIVYSASFYTSNFALITGELRLLVLIAIIFAFIGSFFGARL